MRKVRKSAIMAYIYAIRIERVNQISGQNFIGLKYVSDDIKNVEKIFEKKFFGGWGRLTRSIRSYFSKFIDFWPKFLKFQIELAPSIFKLGEM